MSLKAGGFMFDLSNSVLSSSSTSTTFKEKDNQNTTDTFGEDNTTKTSSDSSSTIPEIVSAVNDDADNFGLEYASPVFVPKVKTATLSSGRQIVLKPKKQLYLTDNQIHNKTAAEIASEHSKLINMTKLYTKLEIQQKIREEEAKYVRSSLKPTFNVKKKDIGKLWTEKYRPKNFLDLIGSEGTNRYILHWLAQWNEVSLNKPNPESRSKAYQNDHNINKPILVDPFNRPKRKILLIHGQPGVGKTSIAHAIARQMEYDIQEINASDERAGPKVKEKVMNSLNNTNFSGKPSCLIIDEIDGASESYFLNFLVDLINADRRATMKVTHSKDGESGNSNNNNRNSSNFNRANKVKGLLKRPIIAMCNDIYANSLEKLKPFCEIVQLRKPPRHLTLSALRKICKKESVHVTDKFLGYLIDSTEGDLRNCINFLQFNSNNATSGNLEDDGFESSSKDTQVSWFLLLNDIFNRRHTVSKKDRFDQVLTKLASSDSSIEKVNYGCFNVMHDLETVNLKKLNEVSDWLFFNDLISTKFTDFDRTDLTFYNCVSPMKFFQLFSEIGAISDAKRLSYKTKDTFYEFKKQYSEMIHGMKYRNLSTNETNLMKYELSLLNNIMTPTNLNIKSLVRFSGGLKSSNGDDNNNSTYKTNHIFDLIDDYRFKFEIKRIDDFSENNRFNIRPQSYIFKPNVDLTSFGLPNVGARNENKRSILLNRIHGEYLTRRDSAAATGTSAHEYYKKRKQEKEKENSENGSSDTTSEKKTRPNESRTVDFFKNKYSNFAKQIRGVTNGNGEGEVNSDDIANGKSSNNGGTKSIMSDNENRIWIKYHEGFSNAVRREIKWEDIFS